MEENTVTTSNFIRDIIDEDLEKKTYTKVHTRFPPDLMATCILGMLNLFA